MANVGLYSLPASISAEFMEFSTIPPFKVYFNIDFTGKQRKRSSGKKKAISLTEENFRQLDESYKALK